MVFMLAGYDRDSRLITPKNDGDEDGSVCIDIYRNKVLFVGELASANILCEVHLHTGPKPSRLT